jgi:hypothetical protein
MKQVKCTLKKIAVITAMTLLIMISREQPLYCQETTGTDIQVNSYKKNYLGTSVFVLYSLAPNDNTYFFEIDYGRKLNVKNDLVAGMNIYKYTLPMSSPASDDVSYPGYVISYGAVLAYQHYIWRKLFIDQMMNPLILNYYSDDKSKAGTGFMLLFATRIGYHFDFNIFRKPFYLEAGGEISYWPVNTGVPKEFDKVDSKYRNYVFSPALQFGYRF